MTIQIDTREHKQERERIEKQFSELEVEYFRSKLYVGDYMNLDNPRLVIDRKKNLEELCGNVCQQHKRFRSELLRAIEHNIKIIILCEHGGDIQSIEDVYFWQNPRKHDVVWKTVNGKRVKTVQSKDAIDGRQLYRSLCTTRDRYGVRLEFCSKEETGKRIVELLGGQL